MGAKKSDGGMGAIQAAQDRATTALVQGRDQGYGFLDTAKQEGLANVNPLLGSANKITQGSMDYMANFDQNANQKAQEADLAYRQPALRAQEEQLRNLFGSMGVGGRNNSRGQTMVARLSEEAAMNEAQRRYDLNNQVRQQQMQEQQNLYNFGWNPIAYQSGVVQDIGKAKANTAVGTASNLGSTYMQGGQMMANAQQTAEASNAGKKGGMMGMASGAIGGIGKMFASKGGK